MGRSCLVGAGPDGHLCWEGRPETRQALMAGGHREAVSPGGGLVWGSGPSRQTIPRQRKGKEALGEAGTCGQLYQLLTAVGGGGWVPGFRAGGRAGSLAATLEEAP